MSQTDLSGYACDEKAEKKVKLDPVRVVGGALALAALVITFYFGFTDDDKTRALCALGGFAAVAGGLLLYSKFRRYKCGRCGAPTDSEWHDMRPDDRRHARFRVGAVHGISDEVTYAKAYPGHTRNYRKVHVCHRCRLYVWGEIGWNVRVPGTREALAEYEEERRQASGN